MSNIVKFIKVNGIGIILFQCSDFSEDGSFTTRTQIGNNFSKHYISKKISYGTFRITPKVSYKQFESTKNHKEANLLKISFDMGTETKEIVSIIDSKTFVVDDDIPVEYRVPTEKYPNGGEEKAKGRKNNILKYVGLDHIKKPKELMKYSTDKYTKIELMDDCRYELFKLKNTYEKIN